MLCRDKTCPARIYLIMQSCQTAVVVSIIVIVIVILIVVHYCHCCNYTVQRAGPIVIDVIVLCSVLGWTQRS